MVGGVRCIGCGSVGVYCGMWLLLVWLRLWLVLVSRGVLSRCWVLLVVSRVKCVVCMVLVKLCVS